MDYKNYTRNSVIMNVLYLNLCMCVLSILCSTLQAWREQMAGPRAAGAGPGGVVQGHEVPAPRVVPRQEEGHHQWSGGVHAGPVRSVTCVTVGQSCVAVGQSLCRCWSVTCVTVGQSLCRCWSVMYRYWSVTVSLSVSRCVAVGQLLCRCWSVMCVTAHSACMQSVLGQVLLGRGRSRKISD